MYCYRLMPSDQVVESKEIRRASDRWAGTISHIIDEPSTFSPAAHGKLPILRDVKQFMIFNPSRITVLLISFIQ